MSEQTKPEETASPASGIPAPLIDDLHHANEKFHEARKHVDDASGALVNPFEERDRASAEVREAERAVEEIEQKIEKELKKG